MNAGKNAVENNSLTGDRIQQNTIESAEHWKDKARETLGENAASLIINTAITAAAEGMSGTVGIVDTASDILAALVACSAGDSYCTQAKADLNKVNDKLGNSFDNLVSGNAWNEAVKSITAANNGDQKAQENIAALLASILAPAKIVGNPVKTESLGNKVENIVSDASNTNKIDSSANSAANGLNLNKYLASEQQLSELASTGGLPVAGYDTGTELRVAAKLAEQYGGNVSDWSKVTSTSYKAADGTIFEIHAYRNAITGQLVEPKTIPIKK